MQLIEKQLEDYAFFILNLPIIYLYSVRSLLGSDNKELYLACTKKMRCLRLNYIYFRTMGFYDFKEKQGVAKADGSKKLYAGIVYSGTISSQTLIERVADKSGFNAGELEGALMELMNTAAQYIGQGYHVELGEFGFFSGKIKARHVADKKEIRSHSIHFNGVNFRTSKKFRMKAVGDLERSQYMQFYQSRQRSMEELESILLDHLNKNGFITRSTYTSLTGRLKNTALADLKGFMEKGVVQCKGRGNQMHFVRAAQEKREEQIDK